MGQAAERAGSAQSVSGTTEAATPGSRAGLAGRPGSRRGAGRPETAQEERGLEVTAVRVLEAGEEPGTEEGTASDWLPGLRDEHDDDGAGGWQARWLERPTWDHTVTPNVRHRTGRRRRGAERGGAAQARPGALAGRVGRVGGPRSLGRAGPGRRRQKRA